MAKFFDMLGLSLILIVLIFILYTPLAFVHELGHFIVASVLRLDVATFTLGYAPYTAIFNLSNQSTTDFAIGSLQIELRPTLLGGSIYIPLSDSDKASIYNNLFLALRLIFVVSAGFIVNFSLCYFLVRRSGYSLQMFSSILFTRSKFLSQGYFIVVTAITSCLMGVYSLFASGQDGSHILSILKAIIYRTNI
ncbi:MULTISPECIES: site-2 protease family protein [Pelosinus]|uniref:Peptidase M50 n=1 Tax=Pelosinus fermentans B4 TaxID=1149862 RepID=I9LAD1_9FIRM|nr:MULTISPECIES: site-2 protease family protein [Pelosinus]EIW17354.1 peptidase M50 [Pelosinus fermentans B4]EIW23413.1 hypothetical protein FA11_4105 [Pelosinus fermentans A11]